MSDRITQNFLLKTIVNCPQTDQYFSPSVDGWFYPLGGGTNAVRDQIKNIKRIRLSPYGCNRQQVRRICSTLKHDYYNKRCRNSNKVYYKKKNNTGENSENPFVHARTVVEH